VWLPAPLCSAISFRSSAIAAKSHDQIISVGLSAPWIELLSSSNCDSAYHPPRDSVEPGRVVSGDLQSPAVLRVAVVRDIGQSRCPGEQ